MYRLLEDDLNSTLYQSRKIYFNFCNGAYWNLANDAEQQFGKLHLLPLLVVKMLNKGATKRQVA